MSDKVIVGRFGGVHGVKGDIRVHSYTDPIDNIVDYLPWQVRRSKHEPWQPLDICHTQWHGDKLFVRIQDITDRDEVRRFTNQYIGIDRSQLPETDEDEYYWSDLIGLNVINTNGRTLGVLDSYIETGVNDVMVVQGEREILIPYTSEAVKSVDLTAKTITVDWESE